MKNKKGNEIYKIIAGVITGLLLALAAAMIAVGDSGSVSDFLLAGEVYDFSQETLTKSNDEWIYNAEQQYFEIVVKNAIRRFNLDGKEKCWGYLYVNVDKLNVSELEAELRYYNKDKERIFKENIVLRPGENEIALQSLIPVAEIGFNIKDAKGVCISLESMQIREKQANYVPMRFWGVFVVVYVIFLMIWLVGRKMLDKHVTEDGSAEREQGTLPGELLSYLYEHIGAFFAAWRTKRVSDLELGQRLTFSLLFITCIAANVLGWQTDEVLYRYYLIGSAVLLLIAGGLCVPAENRKKKVIWKSPVAYAWLALWIGTVISDFFAGGQIHFGGYVMILAAGFFIYRWNQMARPEKVLSEMMEALEIVFGITLLICVLFRPKLLAVQYNGVFRNPEENAMFALLMVVVLGVALEQQMCMKHFGLKMSLCLTELALAVYMVLRAENKVGYVILVILVVIFVCRFVGERKQWFGYLKKNVGILLLSIFLAAGFAGAFHVGIKYVPEKIGLALTYEEEEKRSQESEQVLTELSWYDAKLVEDVVREEEIEKNIIQTNYLRKLNLYGNGKNIKVFREKVPAYSGYLYMAYRYGIFILVPFVMYQIIVLAIGIRGIRTGGKQKAVCNKGQRSLLISGIAIIYVGFCLCGNADASLNHPLMLCMYLMTGCLFCCS